MRTFLPFFGCFYTLKDILIGNLSYVNLKTNQSKALSLHIFLYSLFLRTAILFLCNLQILLKDYHRSLLNTSLIKNAVYQVAGRLVTW